MERKEGQEHPDVERDDDKFRYLLTRSLFQVANWSIHVVSPPQSLRASNPLVRALGRPVGEVASFDEMRSPGFGFKTFSTEAARSQNLSAALRHGVSYCAPSLKTTPPTYRKLFWLFVFNNGLE